MLLCTLPGLFFIETVSASTFAGGSGTSIDPYQISNVHELQNMSTDLTAHYVLTNNIEASATIGWNSGAGFMPIGTSSTPFSGSFDGKGHTISNLYIYRPMTNYIGLLGSISTGGFVSNLTLDDNEITGYDYTGALAGYSGFWVEVINCGSTGNVNGNHNVGGLVSYSYNSLLSHCYSNCNVSGSDDVGGLVGKNIWSEIEKSYTSGNVISISEYPYNIGGLLGYSESSELNSCYSTSNVYGNYANVGGLVGVTHSCSVKNSYARGNVSGEHYVGGLVGQNAYSNLQKCYSTGYVEGGYYSGGLVGLNLEGTILNSFWDTETSGQTTISGGTGKTTAEMKDVATFTNESTESLDEAWDFVGDPYDDAATEDIWDIDSEKNDGYPYLSWQVFEEPIEVKEYTLYADKDIEVGKIIAWNDGDYLYVNFTLTAENWYLTEINLDVDNDISDIPQNKKGNPIVGWFTYRWLYTTPETTWHLTVIDISDEDLSGDIIIAAHAAVANHNYYPVVNEGAWAASYPGENTFVNKGNWATYIEYELPT
ncbi:MAG: GLUG motif-containing protein [Candidatus Saliniplasma sp.]